MAEGNNWQYLWLVPGDVEGLIQLLGGEKKFTTKLDSLFALQALPDPKAPPDIAGLIGQYALAMSLVIIIYLYAYAGKQWKSAESKICFKSLYGTDPDNGMSSNDDCGQMSAWYIFIIIRFLSVLPANGACFWKPFI